MAIYSLRGTAILSPTHGVPNALQYEYELVEVYDAEA
jgi:hypothetical protein